MIHVSILRLFGIGRRCSIVGDGWTSFCGGCFFIYFDQFDVFLYTMSRMLTTMYLVVNKKLTQSIEGT